MFGCFLGVVIAAWQGRVVGMVSAIQTAPVCSDVNECNTNKGGFHSKRKCINAAGSMKCADCSAGYANDGAKGCKGLGMTGQRLLGGGAVNHKRSATTLVATTRLVTSQGPVHRANPALSQTICTMIPTIVSVLVWP